jgi:hypothetical protein
VAGISQRLGSFGKVDDHTRLFSLQIDFNLIFRHEKSAHVDRMDIAAFSLAR